MAKRLPVLITRPLPQGENFAKKVQALGFETILHPVLRLTTLSVPSFPTCKIAVFTSARALHALPFFVEQGGGHVFCVGSSLREDILQEYPHLAVSAFPTVEDLVQERRLHQAVYFSGREISQPLPVLARVIVYDMPVNLSPFPPTLSKTAAIGTFFSQRTAEVFERLRQAQNLPPLPFSVCISEKVAACIEGKTVVAPSPDEVGMLTALNSSH